MKLRQLSIRFPLAVASGDAVAQADGVIDVFHGWIRTPPTFLRNELLLDVVDYRHVHDGPGVLLFAAGAIVSVGSRGLQVSRKRDALGPAETKIKALTDQALALAAELEARDELDLQFERTTVEISMFDRACSPSSAALAAATAEVLSSHLAAAVQSRPDDSVPGLATAISRIS